MDTIGVLLDRNEHLVRRVARLERRLGRAHWRLNQARKVQERDDEGVNERIARLQSEHDAMADRLRVSEEAKGQWREQVYEAKGECRQCREALDQEAALRVKAQSERDRLRKELEGERETHAETRRLLVQAGLDHGREIEQLRKDVEMRDDDLEEMRIDRDMWKTRADDRQAILDDYPRRAEPSVLDTPREIVADAHGALRARRIEPDRAPSATAGGYPRPTEEGC